MPLAVSHSKRERWLEQPTTPHGLSECAHGATESTWSLLPPSEIGRGLRGLMQMDEWSSHWGDKCLPSTIAYLYVQLKVLLSQYMVSICLIWSKFLYVSGALCQSQSVLSKICDALNWIQFKSGMLSRFGFLLFPRSIKWQLTWLLFFRCSQLRVAKSQVGVMRTDSVLLPSPGFWVFAIGENGREPGMEARTAQGGWVYLILQRSVIVTHSMLEC